MHPADDVELGKQPDKNYYKPDGRNPGVGWVKMDRLIEICGENFGRAVATEPNGIDRRWVEQGKDGVVEYLITDASLNFYADWLYKDLLRRGGRCLDPNQVREDWEAT